MQEPQNTQWYDRAGRLLSVEKDGVCGFDMNYGRALHITFSYCSRCGGQGGSQAWAHTGYTCYKCGGSGGRQQRMAPCYTKERLEQLNSLAEAKAEAKRQKLAREEQARLERRRTEYQEWLSLDWVDAKIIMWGEQQHESTSDFIADMARKIRDMQTLTEPQYQALARCYEREVQHEQQCQESRYLADVGVKIGPLRVKLVRVLDWSKPDSYPPIYRYMHEMHTEDKQVLIYTGNSQQLDYAVGAEFFISGKVKDHKEFRGLKQTVIERPTTKEIPNGDEVETRELFQPDQG